MRNNQGPRKLESDLIPKITFFEEIVCINASCVEEIHSNIKYEDLLHPPRSRNLGSDQLLLSHRRGEELPPGQGRGLR